MDFGLSVQKLCVQINYYEFDAFVEHIFEFFFRLYVFFFFNYSAKIILKKKIVGKMFFYFYFIVFWNFFILKENLENQNDIVLGVTNGKELKKIIIKKIKQAAEKSGNKHFLPSGSQIK